MDMSKLAEGRTSAYHGMEIYLHHQLLHSPLRVYNAEDSDIVYVPLYPIVAVYDKGPSGLGPCIASETKARSAIDRFLQQVDTLLPFIGRKPHWIPLATLELEHMEGCGGWGSSMLCDNKSSNFIFTVPEIATVGMALPPTPPTTFNTSIPQHDNVVAVPYFGHFHMHQITAHKNATMILSEKSALAALVIGARGGEHGAPLRPKLRRDCSARQDMCHAGYDIDEQNNNVNVATAFDLYKYSWFCVNPYGDTPTRLAFYDCAAMGAALPVVFDEQFQFVSAFSDVIDYSQWLVNLNLTEALSDDNNIFEMLDEVNVEERLRRLHALQHVSHLFQYAVMPTHNLITFQEMGIVHEKDDAFTAGVKGIMRNLCRRNHLPLDVCKLGNTPGCNRITGASGNLGGQAG